MAASIQSNCGCGQDRILETVKKFPALLHWRTHLQMVHLCTCAFKGATSRIPIMTSNTNKAGVDELVKDVSGGTSAKRQRTNNDGSESK